MSDVFLRPPWSNLHRQHQAVLLGMWVFLGSEVLLFAGLFAGYTVYRSTDGTTFTQLTDSTRITGGAVSLIQ